MQSIFSSLLGMHQPPNLCMWFCLFVFKKELSTMWVWIFVHMCVYLHTRKGSPEFHPVGMFDYASVGKEHMRTLLYNQGGVW